MKKISFDAISPFNLKIDHPVSSTPITSHVHQECEIYVNVTGNVSFMVENNLYPIFHGNAIITRPYEFHNCIYHDNSTHEHYCITFDVNENHNLLKMFFDRKAGTNNLISLDEEKTQELLNVCYELSSDNVNKIKQISLFFNLLSLLNDGVISENTTSKNLPQDVLVAINYIHKHLTEKITLNELAEISGVSINSLERHFDSTFNMTPFTYIQRKRLAYSAKLLSKNYAVIDACYDSGFTDYPHYIALFKKYYGLTPLKYKKSLLK